MRIEDVDTPRSVPGAADAILRTLDAFAFSWDGEVLVQSRRIDRYHAVLCGLQLDGEVYPCACSRSEIAALAVASAVDGGLVYPGTCRPGLAAGRAARAWRMSVPDRSVSFIDRVQGVQAQNLAREVGDFVLLRADGQFAYQLAVVVDDADQGITAVVRGADLLASTPRQIWLQQRLGAPTPSHAHLPVAVDASGQKLSKQTLAPAVDPVRGAALLVEVLAFLGQSPPSALARASLAEFWEWAIAHWSMERVPRGMAAFAGSPSVASLPRTFLPAPDEA